MLETPRAVAPPAGTGDANRLYYPQTRFPTGGGSSSFQGIQKEAIMAKPAYRKTEPNLAAIYARVSDKSQDAGDKTSISEQISDMEAHCKRRGLTIVARYQEVGRGWSKKRPEFQRMLADARQGRFDTIVCWKSDRLSRGMYPAAALMEVVEAHRINLQAVMDAIDMKTFGLMAAVGKIELDNFRERSSMGKRGTAKQGRIPISNVPYGYRIGEDGRPEVVEAEAEVVRRVYRTYVRDGKGAPAITRQLNSDGVPLAKEGKRWYDGTVHRILSNETYKGTWWYGKARYVSTEEGIQVYEQPEEEWIAVPFPPLVDEEYLGASQGAPQAALDQSQAQHQGVLPVAAHDEMRGMRVPHGRIGEYEEGSQAQRQGLQVRDEPSPAVTTGATAISRCAYSAGRSR